MAIALFEGFLGREAEVGGVKCTVDLEATMNADLDIGPRSGEARLSREEVLHREGGRLWPIAAALALGVVACVALAAAGRVDNAYGLAVALGCIWLAGLVPYFVSRRLYSTVTVTTRELRVGREAFPIAELDRELLERQLREDHRPSRHATPSAARVQA